MTPEEMFDILEEPVHIDCREEGGEGSGQSPNTLRNGGEGREEGGGGGGERGRGVMVSSTVNTTLTFIGISDSLVDDPSGARLSNMTWSMELGERERATQLAHTFSPSLLFLSLSLSPFLSLSLSTSLPPSLPHIPSFSHTHPNTALLLAFSTSFPISWL